MFAAAGVPVFADDRAPTWDELAAVSRKLTRRDGTERLTQIGFPAVPAQFPDFQFFSDAFGEPFITADGGPNVAGFLEDKSGDQDPVTSGRAATALAPTRGAVGIDNVQEIADSLEEIQNRLRSRWKAGEFEVSF